jgi:hypothetical protein
MFKACGKYGLIFQKVVQVCGDGPLHYLLLSLAHLLLSKVIEVRLGIFCCFSLMLSFLLTLLMFYSLFCNSLSDQRVKGVSER